MAQRVVPAAILQNLIELSLRSRLNLGDLFGEAGIDPDALGRPDATVSLERIDRLFQAAFARADDPWLGLNAGLGNQYTSLDLLGKLMATSSTLRDAVRELLRFKDLVAPFLEFTFAEEQGAAVLACRPNGSFSFAETRAHNDLVVATVVSIGRSLAGGELQLLGVEFRHQEPADVSGYRRAFGDVPLSFGMPWNRVRFSGEVLDRRLTSAYPQYHERVEVLARQQLLRLTRVQSMAEQVMTLIGARLGVASINIEDIAREFNMTARTLQRRLREEDVTYGQLRDNVRHALACELLADPAIGMDVLALRLGFSDTANFYHAFRRWEGATPGAWRKMQGTTAGKAQLPGTSRAGEDTPG